MTTMEKSLNDDVSGKVVFLKATDFAEMKKALVAAWQMRNAQLANLEGKVVATNEKGEKYVASNASFLNCIKSDYMPPVLAEKIQKVVPELKDMQVGEVRSMGTDALKKAMDIIKEETHESDAS